MKLLIAAATKKEIAPLLEKLDCFKNKPDVLITGVGMVATAFNMAKAFAEKNYDGAVNLGICGSFNRSLKLGEVVMVTEDIFSEMGAEDGEDFILLSDMKLARKSDVFTRSSKRLSFPELKAFKKVNGVTVNTVHGNKKSIAKVLSLYKPAVESMEGAAFFYACNRFNVPALQLRAVSNYVECRNTDNWNMALAVKNLNEAAIRILSL